MTAYLDQAGVTSLAADIKAQADADYAAIDHTHNAVTVKVVSSVGAMPRLSSSVSGECLTLSWTAGTVPTTRDYLVFGKDEGSHAGGAND